MNQGAVLLYDGRCGLCSRTVRSDAALRVARYVGARGAWCSPGVCYRVRGATPPTTSSRATVTD